jgi:hypothetical protein
MASNRLLNAGLNAAFTFVVTYAVARARGAETPLRAGAFGALLIGLLSYVLLGSVDFEALEARAEAAAESAEERAETASPT